MTKKFTYSEKSTGSILSAEEWNNLAQDVSNAVDAINAGGTSNGSSVISITETTETKEDGTKGDTKAAVTINSGISDLGNPQIIELTKKKKGVNTTIVSANNINIEPRETVVVGETTTKGGNISLKPGDDIELCSHHRSDATEVSVKVVDGDDLPVKLQLNASEMTITTKDKTGDNANVFDLTVNSKKNTRGYLKVRAQAIDLRCEDHGGIALQPKGNDGSGHENKIKFEHNGGDGLEFCTFNTQHTSIFTNDYRFNENGTVYAVTRLDPVTTYRENGSIKKVDYPTQSDDFKDVVDTSKACTWGNVVKTSSAFNNNNVHSNFSNGDLSIATRNSIEVGNVYFKYVPDATAASGDTTPFVAGSSIPLGDTPFTSGNKYTIDEIAAALKEWNDTDESGVITYLSGRISGSSLNDTVYAVINYGTTVSFIFMLFRPNIILDSIGSITLQANDRVVFNTSTCSASNGTDTISCSMYDIIKLVNYMKSLGTAPFNS